MNPLAVLTVLIATAIAQRPGYLAGPTYVQLASRFKTDNEETTTAKLNNRLGENDGTTEKIPVDARGDADLVHRLNTWPNQNKPYWLLNAEHIEKHRNPQGNQQPSRMQNTRSGFASQNNNIEDRFYNPYENDRLWYDYFYRPRSWNRFDNYDGSLTRTIRPIQTRGSFAGPI